MRSAFRFVNLGSIVFCLVGCAQMKTTGKVIATPFTVVRDTIDVPLVTLTNVFETWADRTQPAAAPHVGVGGSLWGISPYFGYDLSHYFFRGVSWTLGAIDYVPCRTLWPNYAKGISPWLKEGETWGSLYYPDTRALWRKEPIEPAAPPPEPAPTAALTP